MKRLLPLLLLLLGLALPAHAQFSRIISIQLTNNNGTVAQTFNGPFSLKVGTHCTWSVTGTVATIDCTGGGGTITGGGTGGQVAVWSGATAITGDSNFLYSTTNHNLSVLHTAAITCTGILAVCGDGDGTQSTLLELGQDDQSTLGLIIRNNSAMGSLYSEQIDNSGIFKAENIAGPIQITSGSGDITLSAGVGSANVIANHWVAGTDNTTAGTMTIANGSAAAHTIFTSGATTSNTIQGFAVVPTTGHLLDCTVTTTTCLLHDSGVVTSTVTKTVASGAKALATGAIGSGACTSAQTDTATGTLTTDAIIADFNADPTGTTGYAPTVNGMLTIIKYPTADTVNFKVCNNTLASITPGSITLNWRVVR